MKPSLPQPWEEKNLIKIPHENFFSPCFLYSHRLQGRGQQNKSEDRALTNVSDTCKWITIILYTNLLVFKKKSSLSLAIFSQPGYHGEWNHSSEQVLSHTPLAFTVIYCLHILQYLTVQWCEEVFAPFLIYFFWGSICHTFQIIKHIYILEKDNASKHNAVSKWKCLLWRGGQTYMAQCE